MFCDFVGVPFPLREAQQASGCIRGAGHDGPHAFSLVAKMLMPIVLRSACAVPERQEADEDSPKREERPNVFKAHFRAVDGAWTEQIDHTRPLNDCQHWTCKAARQALLRLDTIEPTQICCAHCLNSDHNRCRGKSKCACACYHPDHPAAVPVQEADEEMVPHAFNLRTHPQVGEEIREGIWCKDCEYHRDHEIHRPAVPVQDAPPQGGK